MTATRLQEAREGWRGPDRRSLLLGVCTAVVTALVLYVLGDAGWLPTLVGAAVAFALGFLLPFVALGWRSVRVPARLRDAKIDRLLAQVESPRGGAEPVPTKEPLPLSVRVHNAVRYGRDLKDEGFGSMALTQWTNHLVKSLGHDLPEADMATILRAEGFHSRLAALEDVALDHVPVRRTRVRFTHRRDAEHGGNVPRSAAFLALIGRHACSPECSAPAKGPRVTVLRAATTSRRLRAHRKAVRACTPASPAKIPAWTTGAPQRSC